MMRLADLNIEMETEAIAKRTDLPKPFGTRHWRITLKRNGIEEVVFFSQGSAFTVPPTTLEILDSLLMDYRTAEDSYEWFCRDFGYNYDDLEARAIWEACKRNSEKLDRLFEDVSIDTLNEIVSEEMGLYDGIVGEEIPY